MQISVTRALLLSSSACSLIRHHQHKRIAVTTFHNTRITRYDISSSMNTIGLKMMSDPNIVGIKLESPSAERNRDPIWQVLDKKVVVPILLQLQEQHPLKLLEIAAGAGVHTQYFAKQLLLKYKESKQSTSQPPFAWYPTDTDTSCLSSIQAYINDDAELFTRNVVQTPTILTLNEDGIMETENDLKLLDLIMNINMIHISPWSATVGLMKVAGQRLQDKTGVLFLYGPYKVNGTYCESNRCFDESLRQRNKEWGIRDLELVIQEAQGNGLTFIETIDMPANNLCVMFRKL